MNFPVLLKKEIEDLYAQENFKRLGEYFFSDALTKCKFEFLTVTFTGSSTNFKLVHKLGYVPKDVILMHNLNNVTVTFSYSSFDENFIVLTVSGATTLRMLVGRYD